MLASGLQASLDGTPFCWSGVIGVMAWEVTLTKAVEVSNLTDQ